jgi:hypothetical protein
MKTGKYELEMETENDSNAIDNTIPKDPVRYCIDSVLYEARQRNRLRQIPYAMSSFNPEHRDCKR